MPPFDIELSTDFQCTRADGIRSRNEQLQMMREMRDCRMRREKPGYETIMNTTLARSGNNE